MANTVEPATLLIRDLARRFVLIGAGDFSPPNGSVFATKVPCSDQFATSTTSNLYTSAKGEARTKKAAMKAGVSWRLKNDLRMYYLLWMLSISA